MDSAEEIRAIQRMFALCAMDPVHMGKQHTDEATQYFDRGLSPDIANLGAGTSFLHVAAQYGNHVMIQLLHKHGADLERKDDNGDRALHTAIQHYHNVAIGTLLELGADVNASGQMKNTALHYAISRGNERIFETVLEYNPIIDARDVAQNTPLMVAAVLGRDRFCKELLARGADVNAVNASDASTTPIIFSLGQAQSAETPVLLFRHGADLEQKNTAGESALSIINERSANEPGQRRLQEEVRRYFAEAGDIEYYTVDADKKGELKRYVQLAAAVDEFYPLVIRPLLDKKTSEATVVAAQLYHDLPDIFRKKYAALGQQLQQQATESSPVRRRA